jgi:DNA-binding CsgD family transcriptional regulator/PAS domain-containing protein
MQPICPTRMPEPDHRLDKESCGDLKTMSTNDLFVHTVEAIYASGLDDSCLPEALEATGRLLGGCGATHEIVDKKTTQHVAYCATGLPPAGSAQYVERYAALSPRLPAILRQRTGDLGWDHKFFDEKAMERDPFYSVFLARLDLRYFITAVLEQSPDRLAVVSVQRTPKQGHVDSREILLMQRLFPHFHRSYDMRARLKVDNSRNDILENALDLLADGVALLRADGRLVYANEALRKLASHGIDFSIGRGALEFSSPDVRGRFDAALSTAQHFGDPCRDPGPTDFGVPREGGLPPYTVSVRPLLRGKSSQKSEHIATLMVLVHDPLDRNLAAGRMLQDLFGLTRAEAHLVCALGTGTTAGAYADKRQVSIATVYTHLRRTREKTGWKSVAELTRRFNELNMTLRPS